MPKKSLDANRHRWGYVFVFPQMISLIFLGALPVITSFVLSMFDWNGLRDPVFVGLENFKYVFNSPDTYTALKNTLIYTVIYVPCNMVLSLFLAILLNKAFGRVFYRAVFFLPQIVTSVAVAVIWSWLYQPQYGIFNSILNFFGFESVAWLRNTGTAMGSVIVMSIWWGLGYNTVLFLAALQNVPKAYVEAAKIDGANAWHTFKNVTLPMISPTTLLVLVTSLINSFQVFDQCYLLTSGGPAKRTYTLAIYIYETAFTKIKLGRASAISLIMFFVIVGISVLQFRLSDKWVNYDT